MSSPNRSRFPWAGILALVTALVVAGYLLVGNLADPGQWLQPWYVTRASGLIAYLLLWGALSVGLLQSLGMLKGVTAPLANLDVHEHLSLWSLYATVFHAVILLWDTYVPFSLAEITIPLASDYQPALVAMGIIPFYLGLAVTVSTYLRSRLSPSSWRAIHLLSLIAFLLALVHGVLLGTDSQLPAVAYLYRFTGFSVAGLVIYRAAREIQKRQTAGRA